MLQVPEVVPITVFEEFLLVFIQVPSALSVVVSTSVPCGLVRLFPDSIAVVKPVVCVESTNVSVAVLPSDVDTVTAVLE
jgi:hypothetical protein